LVPTSSRLEALDFRASRDTLLGPDVSQYRILHIATHGFVHPDHPELSGLALSMVDRDGQAVDGFLRAHIVQGLDLPVEMVVLSACQTAIGRDVTGGG
jgi:CHAT domain-containing protein